MDWDTHMETLNQRQEFLIQYRDTLAEVASGRDFRNDRPKTDIERLVDHVVRNPHLAYRLVEVALSTQVEFNKTVMAMLTDLDHGKVDTPGRSAL